MTKRRSHMPTRNITVEKSKVLEHLKKNKEAHILEYAQAVVDYKDEALFQLKALTKDAKQGSLDIDLNLTTPIDNTEKYDKLITALEWEIDDTITLSQGEFNEYVHDEFNWAVHSKMSNMAYFKG